MCLPPNPDRPQPWQTVLRRGVFPQLTDEELDVLAEALADDDDRLIQGATVRTDSDGRPVAGCLIAYCGFAGRGLCHKHEVDAFFADVCFEADRLLCEPAGVRWLLQWFDVWPREEVWAALYDEVAQERGRRHPERSAWASMPPVAGGSVSVGIA